MSGVVALEGAVRDYEWGSPTAIPQLLGVRADGRPVAELWLGAHPDDPSPVPATGRTLDELIAADPVGTLGTSVVDRFGPRLPFLLKILAASKALSIQVHPDLRQAEAGYAAEDAAGVARDSPHRNYRDRNHKPELLCALSRFEALCGFRPVRRTAALLEAVAVPELTEVRAALDGPDPQRAAFTAVLTRTEPAPAVEAILRRLPTLAEVDAGAARAVELTAADRPGDVGVLLTLLLNYLVLRPGESIFLPAGNVHAYLRGTGVEIMANSDNVLRCGLTGKHVDVAELLRITDFAELTEPRWPGTPVTGGLGFRPDVADFQLLRLRPDGGVEELAPGVPSIVLCTEGAATVGGVALRPGRAAFVPADAVGIGLGGSGTVFVAQPGVQPR
jgi:mannose-6-phosphate isomerase